VELDYDDRDALVARREPAGTAWSFARGPNAELDEAILDPSGLALRSAWGYDAAGRLERFEDPAGAVTTWARDALGRAIRMRAPDGSEWWRSFVPGGGRIEHTAPSGTRVTVAYDGPGLGPTSLTCVASAGTEAVPAHAYAYDELGRLASASVA